MQTSEGAQPSSERPDLRDIVTDALRYWEPRRLIYNAALALTVVLTGIGAPRVEPWADLSMRDVLWLLLCIGIANVAYCAAYVADVFVQNSRGRERWREGRWMLLFVGTGFAMSLAACVVWMRLGH